jgi:hypothetical protein
MEQKQGSGSLQTKPMVQFGAAQSERQGSGRSVQFEQENRQGDEGGGGLRAEVGRLSAQVAELVALMKSAGAVSHGPPVMGLPPLQPLTPQVDRSGK